MKRGLLINRKGVRDDKTVYNISDLS